jgi:hypothetical protein
VAARHFTPEEANRALADVRPLAERMVTARRALARAQSRRAELFAKIAGNGGRIQPSELGRLATEAEKKAASVARCVERIHALGAQVKDIDRGLIDFPAQRGDEDILLCWRVGEDDVAHWHGVDEGFAGRKPLPY